MKEKTVSPKEVAVFWLEELCRFGSIPNNVFEKNEIRSNACYLENLLQEQGFKVDQWDTPSGKPYVYAELNINQNLPTVLFYSHYDGVPVVNNYWDSPPYEPVLKDATGKLADVKGALENPESYRLYGRSVADSKNAIISILAALNILRTEGVEPGINIKLVLDGEEENESPYLRETVRAHRKELESDLIISASGETHQSGLPTIAFGVRGILMLDLTLHTATADMHSGHFGNFTPNAALGLAQLLTELKSKDGKVLVPGFYKGAKALTQKERAFILHVPKIEQSIKEQFGIAETEQLGSLLELINQPTFNIRGFSAGYVGENAGNIIPATAEASIDIRLVDGMEPDHIYQSIVGHIRENGFFVSDKKPSADDLRIKGPILHITKKGSFKAVKTDMQHGLPAKVLAIVKRSTREKWVVEPTEGGSLNFEVFKEIGTPLITLPVSNFDCNQHTHNENLRVDFFLRGIAIFKELLAFKLTPYQ